VEGLHEQRNPSHARLYPDRHCGDLYVSLEGASTPRFKALAKAKQRRNPCGHFGSFEFELLQILQGWMLG
jgi:hypothetical protein